MCVTVEQTELMLVQAWMVEKFSQQERPQRYDPITQLEDSEPTNSELQLG
jgi:hypothetical protein